MSEERQTTCYPALRCKTDRSRASSIELIGEEPLLIRIDDKPYSVVMRTPGDEAAHAAGFCLGEGIVNSPDDISAIGYSEDLDPNVIDIKLKPERGAEIRDLLDRRNRAGKVNCGICGTEMIEELGRAVNSQENGFKIDVGSVFDCLNALSENQRHYLTTRSSHAALLCDDRREKVSFGEDVGRHNAVDKAIGKAFLNRTLERARMLVISSRISYELVHRAARAHVGMIISDSRPTALAVEAGKAVNMTLAFPIQGSELVVVCGENRIVRT